MRTRRLILAALLATLLVGAPACGGDDDGDDAGATTTATTETGDGGGGTAAGSAVFAEAGCGGCHTLAAANANGTTGPNLDEAQPSMDEVEEQVRNGGGGMPAFEGRLTDQQIEDVAVFVSESAGSGG